MSLFGIRKTDKYDGITSEAEKHKRKGSISLLIISILFAIILWMFVVDPVSTTTISIPVEINGLNDNSYIEGRDIMVVDSQVPQKVDLTIRGRRSYLDKIVAQNFATVLDFTLVEDASQDSIELSSPIYNGDTLKGIRVVGMSQTSVKVDLEDVGGNSFPVEVRTFGTPARNYKVISLTSQPSIIKISGDKNVLQSASKAVAYVDVDGISSGMGKQVEIKIIDKSGNEIESEKGKYYADVDLEIGKKVKVSPSIVGRPNDRYTFRPKKVSVQPKYVLVKGISQVLKDLDKISTEEIDVSTFDHTMDIEAGLILPGGIELVDGIKTVKVNIPIKNVQIKTVQISSSNIYLTNIPDGLNCSVVGVPKSVTVTGAASVLKKLRTADILLSIDMTDANEGNGDYGLTIYKPDDIRLVGEYKAKVNVTTGATE